jgi:GAF domain-containing protein
MKFLRDKKLKHLGAYLVLLACFTFVVQYFLLGVGIRKLEEAELKQEFTRIAQLNNQQISLNVQDLLNGNNALSTVISSQLTEQEHRLKTLSSGGRVEQTEDFVTPLKRLPKITFQGLNEDWDQYKQSIYSILNERSASPSAPDAVESPADSTGAPIVEATTVLVNTGTNTSLIKYKGLSLSMSRWYDRLMADLQEEVESEKSALATLRMVITFLNVALAVALYFLFYRYVLKPLEFLKVNIADHAHTANFGFNEIGQVAQHANHTIEQLKDAADFVMAIGKGNLSISYRDTFDKDYRQGNNRLADSLIDMQAKLKELNEEEQKRQWANEGLARFVDILRSSNDNINALGDKVIASLVQYTRSNQGALYIASDDDQSNKVLELISLFAFDIKKHEQQRIKPGQGILGQTFLERETTYLTALPEEYVRITSGLGGATPKSILIVPLKVDQEVYGLVELASFNEFQSHEIAFVEKLGESIASTLASVRAAQKNRSLIEQFQQHTEQMKSQEEEMRQNMEELQATQEEISRKEKTYISRIADLEKVIKEQSRSQSDEELIRTLTEKEAEYRRKVAQLEKDIETARIKGQDWEVAGELVKTLRINLDALKITAEETHQNKAKMK